MYNSQKKKITKTFKEICLATPIKQWKQQYTTFFYLKYQISKEFWCLILGMKSL